MSWLSGLAEAKNHESWGMQSKVLLGTEEKAWRERWGSGVFVPVGLEEPSVIRGEES